jgi:hypothetical protein
VDGTAERLTMEGPVACVIRVQGALSPHLSARLGGLRITSTGRPDGDGAATSELRGVLRGQAALRGVLTALHGLGLRLVAVACAPPRPAAAPAAAPASVGDPTRGAVLPKPFALEALPTTVARARAAPPARRA